MVKRILLFICMMALIPATQGQIIWLKPQKINDQLYGLTNILETDGQVYPTRKKTLINYNPAISPSEDQIRFSAKYTSFNQCQIFTIYESAAQSSEGLIWSIQGTSSTSLAMTDHRIVDFTKGKFMNFLDRVPNEAQLSTYHHHRLDFTGNRFELGGMLSNPNIPVKTFAGNLAEVIVFDKVLTPESRIRLESSMALKYSISLNIQHDYFDAYGKIIWDHSEHEQYSNRIAGIGKSQVFHLNQKQSKAKFGNGYIAIGVQDIYKENNANPNVLTDQSYLLWGDDDGLIEFVEQQAAPPQLDRNWKIVRQRYIDDHKLRLEIQHKGIQNDLKKGEHLWMIISENEDHSGDAQYAKYDFDAQKKVFSTAIELSSNENQYLHLIKAPELWAKLEITDYNCTLAEGGQVRIQPIGGNAPYQIHMTSDALDYNNQFELDGKEASEVQDLKTGIYTFTITDNNGIQWRTSFHINTAEIPNPNLATTYTLDQTSKMIDLPMYDSPDYDIEWTLPDGTNQQNRSLELNQAGTFLLEIEKNGCSSTYSFEVFDTRNNIEVFSLSPNPTSTGNITVDARLKESTGYTISIHSTDGKIVFRSAHPAAKYIQEVLNVPASGMYWITLQSGASTKTQSLIAELTY